MKTLIYTGTNSIPQFTQARKPAWRTGSPRRIRPVADRMPVFRRRRALVRARFVLIFTALCSAASAKEIYKFEPSGSTIGFSVHQFLGTTQGKFTSFGGKIDVDREHPENSSVNAQIAVRSIDTHIKKRDDHLRSPEFFNVEKFPQIMFKSRSVKQTGPQSGDILGDLTMHGVTRPITLHVKLVTPINETNRTRWAVTTEPISRRDFNLMFSSGAEAVSGISQTVTINIEIEAKRAQ